MYFSRFEDQSLPVETNAKYLIAEYFCIESSRGKSEGTISVANTEHMLRGSEERSHRYGFTPNECQSDPSVPTITMLHISFTHGDTQFCLPWCGTYTLATTNRTTEGQRVCSSDGTQGVYFGLVAHTNLNK